MNTAQATGPDSLRLGRVYGTAALLSAATAAVCLSIGARASLGALLGGGAALLALRWLEGSVGLASAGRPSRRALLAAGSFLLRLTFWGVLAWGASALGEAGAAGFLAGITTLPAAIVAVGLWTARRG